MKIKIFVDFWNLQLSWNEYHRRVTGSANIVRIPWENTLPTVLLNKIDKTAMYEGTHVYASINPKSPNDRSLNAFLQQMDMFQGYKVTVKQRKPANHVRCNTCHKAITHCPHCSGELIRTVEKGVDTSRLPLNYCTLV